MSLQSQEVSSLTRISLDQDLGFDNNKFETRSAFKFKKEISYPKSEKSWIKEKIILESRKKAEIIGGNPISTKRSFDSLDF